LNRKKAIGNDFNCLDLAMRFLETCLHYAIRPELESLCLNLFDKKRDNWRKNIFDNTGPKTFDELEKDAKKEKRKQYNNYEDSDEEPNNQYGQGYYKKKPRNYHYEENDNAHENEANNSPDEYEVKTNTRGGDRKEE